MSVIKPWMWKARTVPITEVQIRNAEDVVSRWEEVKNILGTNGWKHIKKDIEEEYNKANSLLGVDPENLAQKQGYCQGVSFVLARIREYQRSAEQASEILQVAGQQQE